MSLCFRNFLVTKKVESRLLMSWVGPTRFDHLMHHPLLWVVTGPMNPSSLLRCYPWMTCRSGTKLCRSLSSSATIKIAVIGSGPAGFYLTQQLLKAPNILVDIYEKFPTPFGLVRYGVAPDHPEVKNVEHSFTKTAENDRVSFLGNVNIGHPSQSDNPQPDLTLKEIRDSYNVVALCYGSAKDRQLNISGESLENVLSARRFVGWYNGVPSDQNLPVNLNGDSCAIIGHGNVAIDCARILLTPVDNVLIKTDITSKAIRLLKDSHVKRVNIIGRRGPLQVSFTIKELRELTKICPTLVYHEDVDFLSKSFVETLPRARRRLTELIMSLPRVPRSHQSSNDRHFIISFNRSPLVIEKSANNLNIKFVVNKLVDPFDEKSKLEKTEITENMETSLIIKSLGYTTISLDPNLPMDDKNGCIKNDGGRIENGLYCSGWAATGPSGVLLGTMNVSFDVGKRILKDAERGQIDLTPKEGRQAIIRLLQKRNVQFVTFDDWKKIDLKEVEMGQAMGKPREKITEINDLLSAAKRVKE